MNKIDMFRSSFADEFNQGNFKSAIDTGRRLLYEHAHFNRVGTEGYVRDMYNLALAYEESGDRTAALELYRNSAWYSSHLDQEGLLFATCLSGIAALLGEMGQSDSAYFMYAKACEINAEKLGENHPAFADSLYNLANIASDLNMQAFALDQHLKALRIRENSDSKEDLINSLHSIAFIFEAAESYEAATGFAKRAVEAAHDVFDDSTYAASCTYLGDLFAKCDKIEDALDMYSLAADDIMQTAGKEHSAYLNTVFLKATMLAKLGYHVEAIDAYNEILTVFEDSIGERHLFYANSVRNLAIVYEKAGDYYTSKHTMLKAVKTKRQLQSDAALDVMLVLRLNLRLRLFDEALSALVYALMCLGQSSWSQEDGRDLIISIVISELGSESAGFISKAEALLGSEKLEELIANWLAWEA